MTGDFRLSGGYTVGSWLPGRGTCLRISSETSHAPHLFAHPVISEPVILPMLRTTVRPLSNGDFPPIPPIPPFAHRFELSPVNPFEGVIIRHIKDVGGNLYLPGVCDEGDVNMEIPGDICSRGAPANRVARFSATPAS